MITAWNTIVISAGLVLLFFLCRKEMERRNKARLLWRIIASVVAVLSLVCMGLPLTLNRSVVSDNKEMIIVTKGANEDSVRHFNNSRGKKIPVIQSEEFLSAKNQHYDTVHVFGYGFSADELETIQPVKLVFHPSVIRAGITTANWNRKLKKGEELLIQGAYINSGSFPVTLALSGFGTVIDSLIVPSNSNHHFSLHGIPKQNGKAVYSVIALHGKDTLEKAPVPIVVADPLPVKLMILSASPNFENKFLKDWLSQNGYTVVNKTAISSNRFDKSSYNTANRNFDHITPALLDSFDIVLSDETSLASLSKPEQENIAVQVRKKGLGLLVSGDTIASANAWYTRSFHLYGLTGKQPSQIAVSLLPGNQKKAILPVDQPKFIRAQNSMQALFTDSADNIVAGSIMEGRGRIIFTTIQNTYSWLLSGNQVNYYSFWTRLLQKAGSSPGSGIAGRNYARHACCARAGLPTITNSNGYGSIGYG